MKTTLDLPEELIREVKLLAVLQRRTLKDLVAEFLRQGGGMAPTSGPPPLPASSRVETGEDGLPVIRCCPGAPATRMSVAELLELEQQAQVEEDLTHAGFSF